MVCRLSLFSLKKTVLLTQVYKEHQSIKPLTSELFQKSGSGDEKPTRVHSAPRGPISETTVLIHP